MAKWVTTFFRLAQANGERPIVSATAYRGLALLRVKTGEWSLTHMKTGYSIVHIEGDYAGARRVGEAIADLTEWNDVNSTEEAVAVPGLLDRLQHTFVLLGDFVAGNA